MTSLWQMIIFLKDNDSANWDGENAVEDFIRYRTKYTKPNAHIDRLVFSPTNPQYFIMSQTITSIYDVSGKNWGSIRGCDESCSACVPGSLRKGCYDEPAFRLYFPMSAVTLWVPPKELEVPKEACKCPLREVLLISGCQCGGG